MVGHGSTPSMRTLRRTPQHRNQPLLHPSIPQQRSRQWHPWIPQQRSPRLSLLWNPQHRGQPVHQWNPQPSQQRRLWIPQLRCQRLLPRQQPPQQPFPWVQHRHSKLVAVASHFAHRARTVQKDQTVLLRLEAAKSVGIAGTGMMMSLMMTMTTWIRIAMLCTRTMTGMMMRSGALPTIIRIAERVGLCLERRVCLSDLIELFLVAVGQPRVPFVCFAFSL